ncbi:hypothetical protein ATANTOWER_016682 [Ataeniobius toweri]|uniref:Uncharacterized protein n=1 Tax=Ataeniobius toweri TaxID=208326 RepID=A0ABU7AZP7_9TELE|nr:hypothetical protein [Ataeniobius toweri]
MSLKLNNWEGPFCCVVLGCVEDTDGAGAEEGELRGSKLRELEEYPSHVERDSGTKKHTTRNCNIRDSEQKTGAEHRVSIDAIWLSYVFMLGDNNVSSRISLFI